MGKTIGGCEMMGELPLERRSVGFHFLGDVAQTLLEQGFLSLVLLPVVDRQGEQNGDHDGDDLDQQIGYVDVKAVFGFHAVYSSPTGWICSHAPTNPTTKP